MDLLLFLDSVELDSLSAEESELAHALDEEDFIKPKSDDSLAKFILPIQKTFLQCH